MARWHKRSLKVIITVAIFAAVVVFALNALDRAFPPPLPQRLTTSTEVRDRDDALLRVYAIQDGIWRLRTRLEDVDPTFVKMLIAYEDKRFFEHSGVDVFAFIRSAWQLATHGRIVSGGSTITMQVARLIEPRKERSFGLKLLQIARAFQIERRLSKPEILERYLTLAPYGGNLEGVRAAAFSYFGKEPKRLSIAEAALLTALPQLPERRRPDRHFENAMLSRERVLQRVVDAGVIDAQDLQIATRETIPKNRLALPALAAHMSDRALRLKPQEPIHRLTLKKTVQQNLEVVASGAASNLGPHVSVAMVLADSRNGNILASVGSPDYFDSSRKGWIDMTRVVRSPGSTLKPFIYGLGFEDGLIAQETIIEDRPQNFSGYRPRNFDLSYQGDVSIRQALQMSLNVPAISLLEAVGPMKLMSRFRQAGIGLQLPRDAEASLAIGLGGVGITLRDLVQAYTALADGGSLSQLRDGTEITEPVGALSDILSPTATWQVGDILSGVNPPVGARKINIAYKTGTSYGYRDAWSVGYDGRYVLGVWVGRPDGAPVSSLTGYGSAAPILFEAFSKSGIALEPLPRAPVGALRSIARDLPITHVRFSGLSTIAPIQGRAPKEPDPQIVNPRDGAHIEMAELQAARAPLVVRLNGGQAPFRLIANGKVLSERVRSRNLEWFPNKPGPTTLTVIDAAGRASSVQIVLE